MAHCSVHIVIEVLLRLQSETYLFMNSPPTKKSMTSSEERIIEWKKYQNDEINLIEYAEKIRLKHQQIY